MNNEEKHLREVLQAALDGKLLQTIISFGKWLDVGSNNSLDYNLELIVKHGAASFRIKPESKVFSYQTRPYYLGIDSKVWVSTSGLTEQEIEKRFNGYVDFKWLAPTTEHEVIINE